MSERHLRGPFIRSHVCVIAAICITLSVYAAHYQMINRLATLYIHIFCFVLNKIALIVCVRARVLTRTCASCISRQSVFVCVRLAVQLAVKQVHRRAHTCLCILHVCAHVRTHARTHTLFIHRFFVLPISQYCAVCPPTYALQTNMPDAHKSREDWHWLALAAEQCRRFDGACTLTPYTPVCRYVAIRSLNGLVRVHARDDRLARHHADTTSAHTQRRRTPSARHYMLAVSAATTRSATCIVLIRRLSTSAAATHADRTRDVDDSVRMRATRRRMSAEHGHGRR
jgi:hypothetical protein